jgi:hypothetical protein
MVTGDRVSLEVSTNLQIPNKIVQYRAYAGKATPGVDYL